MSAIKRSISHLIVPVDKLNESFPSHFDGRWPFQNEATDQEGVVTYESWTIGEMIEDDRYKSIFGGSPEVTFEGVTYRIVGVPFSDLQGDRELTTGYWLGIGETAPNGSVMTQQESSDFGFEAVDLA